MAETRKLCVGFSSATRVARFQLGSLEVSFYDEAAKRWRIFVLTEETVRKVDLNLERWRREEHEAVLLTMNGDNLGRTLWQAADAGGRRDITFLLSRGVDVNAVIYPCGLHCTALFRASAEGHLEVVTLLLDAGADGLAEAVFAAAGRGQIPTTTLLLDLETWAFCWTMGQTCMPAATRQFATLQSRDTWRWFACFWTAEHESRKC